MNIGVLSLQGGVIEHLKQIELLGHNPIEVKEPKDLENIHGIILPGGESTTIGRLLIVTGLMEPLRKKIEEGFPVWGTCAGMILLAKEIENDRRRHLAVMDIKVKRNAFGTQIDSFKIKKTIEAVSNRPLDLVFIRAPYVIDIGEEVDVLCKINDNIVGAIEKNILVTSFHPELTDNLEFLRYFVENFIKKSYN